jgi:hypothetical protein
MFLFLGDHQAAITEFSADFTDQGAAAFGQSEHRVAERLAGVFQQSRNKSREDGDFTLKNLHCIRKNGVS